MENKTANESIKVLNEEIDEAFTAQKKQKEKNQVSFLQRNKKLIIVIILILSVLFIITSVYVHWGLNQIYQELYIQK